MVEGVSPCTRLLLVVGVLQIGMCIWVASISVRLREIWLGVDIEEDSRVFVANIDRFWGPVYIMVPKECSTIEYYQSLENTSTLAADNDSSSSTSTSISISTTTSTSSSITSVDAAPVATAAVISAPTTTANAPTSTAAVTSAPSTTANAATTTAAVASALSTTANSATTTDVLTADEVAQIDASLQNALSESSEHDRRLKIDELHRWMEAMLPGYRAGGHLSDHTVEVDVCNGENETFQPPHIWNRYLSMYTLTRIRGPIVDNLEDFREQRRRTFLTLAGGLVVCMIAKYGLQSAEVMSRLVGQRYMQVWNGSRTRFDRVLESLLLHGIAVVFTLAMQISMCTVYLQFWRRSHFVMCFMPALGFRVFVTTLTLLFVLDLCDRVGHFTIHWSNRMLYIMWYMVFLWMCMIAIPMVGYSVTSIQFVIELWWSGWLDTEGALFGDDFEHLAMKATGACAAFICIAVADICVILSMDLEHYGGENETITTTRLITPSSPD